MNLEGHAWQWEVQEIMTRHHYSELVSGPSTCFEVFPWCDFLLSGTASYDANKGSIGGSGMA